MGQAAGAEREWERAAGMDSGAVVRPGERVAAAQLDSPKLEKDENED